LCGGSADGDATAQIAGTLGGVRVDRIYGTCDGIAARWATMLAANPGTCTGVAPNYALDVVGEQRPVDGRRPAPR
jgi:hypothetical protein